MSIINPKKIIDSISISSHFNTCDES